MPILCLPSRRHFLCIRRLILRLSIFALILPGTFCPGTFGFGQAGKTELFGTISDPSNLPVPNAKVEAEEQATP